MEINDIKTKLYQKLLPSGWGNRLKGFILSEEFDQILIALDKQIKDDKRFTPTFKQVFRCFEECPYDKLKLVMLFDSPYDMHGIADGIPLSCSLTKDIENPLRHVMNEIRTTVYNHETYDYDKDLKRWANQGVLMIHVSPTTQLFPGKPHFNIWKPFMTYLLDMLDTYNNGLNFAIFGENAFNNYSQHITGNIVTCPNPMLIRGIHGEWNSEDIFNKINKLIIESNGESEKIIW